MNELINAQNVGYMLSTRYHVRGNVGDNNCWCLDQPLDVYINMNVNDISSISETKMASIQKIIFTARRSRNAKRRTCYGARTL